MSNMISVASGFQYSVNIAYDLNKDNKIKNFIPTKSAMRLLEDIILSVNPNSTERSRVLVGAYGKGKSHIVLTILSVLMKKDLSLFKNLLPKIKKDKKLYQEVINYYNSKDKILPVIISGSNTSLTQAFLLSLQRTLNENELMDIMPKTNYEAAISVINRWKKEFPEVYKKFVLAIDCPIEKFIFLLKDFNVDAYKKFEEIYPELTAGSHFNPFLGFDIVELYESVAIALKERGYSGIYLIYDEFSKYLETNIADASVSDTKMLQDFAEKCNRSGKTQLHIMLISHKEVANYIENLPKNKVDGWRGVSERFKHIHLNNNFIQTYEIIGTVIQKRPKLWDDFCEKHEADFSMLCQRYSTHSIFKDDNGDMNVIFKKCYPLHPVSMFILPRLSERVAQNERTLFTFLSAEGKSTLSGYLRKYNDDCFKLITPDLMYDYFEPLFKKEAYISDLHEMYFLTKKILEKLEKDSLEMKIVKTISLIYILEQFERLKPTKDELFGIFSIDYPIKEIDNAINNLIEKEYVVYLKRSNNFLRLKKTSGVDLKAKIENRKEKNRVIVTTKDILNKANFDKYIYPYRYNDDREMVRYFSFEFIEGKEVKDDINWDIKRENIKADGIIYAIIPENKDDLDRVHNILLKSSKSIKDCIFVLPKKYSNIESVVREFEAVKELREESVGDRILFDEYDVIYEDLNEVIINYINSFTRPEEYASTYYFKGVKKNIIKKSELTDLMSDICDDIFFATPVINNEAINRDNPTTMAINSRNKVITSLLRNELEPNLGFTGGGQEVSIMRSTLIRNNILVESDGIVSINFDVDKNLSNMLNVIVDFILNAKNKDSVSFEELYSRLTLPEYGIGLRNGIIPIYIATVLHEYKQNIIIKNTLNDEIPLNLDTIIKINAKPNDFTLSYLEWDSKKSEYIKGLENTFKDFIIDSEKMVNSYDYILLAMKRWYLSLPKYAKEIKVLPDGNKVYKENRKFINKLKTTNSVYEFIFVEIPTIICGTDKEYDDIIEKISNIKRFYDMSLLNLKKHLNKEIKNVFINKEMKNQIDQMSLTSIIKDWCDDLDENVFEQLFTDGSERMLKVFSDISNDENDFINRITKEITGLRLEDWNSDTISLFGEKILGHKNTVESFHEETVESEMICDDSYKLTFIDDEGNADVKRFEKTQISARGKLLYNMVTRDLESMGQSLSMQEKRQIIMNILKELC